MRRLIIPLLGLVCAVSWLGLLVATHFNLVTVSVGLLVVVYVSGSAGTARPTAVRTHRSR
jgi:hypothetical protein